MRSVTASQPINSAWLTGGNSQERLRRSQLSGGGTEMRRRCSSAGRTLSRQISTSTKTIELRKESISNSGLTFSISSTGQTMWTSLALQTFSRRHRHESSRMEISARRRHPTSLDSGNWEASFHSELACLNSISKAGQLKRAGFSLSNSSTANQRRRTDEYPMPRVTIAVSSNLT